MRKLAAGNWKMNGLLENLAEIDNLTQAHPSPKVDILICPPAPLLFAAVQQSDLVQIGAQDCHMAKRGAHTGDISAELIKSTGATSVIVGHSERRQDHGESDATVAAKATAAQEAGLIAIICIGETHSERTSGQTLDVLATQLAGSLPDGCTAQNTVVAYEPVWAIGTGLVPSVEQIEEAHKFIRRTVVERFGDSASQMRLLYGGSVKASNADSIFAIANVDGALVGGASLKSADFSPIVTALENS